MEELDSESYKIPIEIKVLSIFYYVGAIFSLLLGLLFIFAPNLITKLFPLFSSTLFIVAGFFSVVLGIFGFFIGYGLRKRKNSARTLAIIFVFASALLNICLMIYLKKTGSISTIIISLSIGFYLLLSKRVKAFFVKEQEPMRFKNY